MSPSPRCSTEPARNNNSVLWRARSSGPARQGPQGPGGHLAQQANKEFRTMTDPGSIASQGPGRHCLAQHSENRVAFRAKGAISRR